MVWLSVYVCVFRKAQHKTRSNVINNVTVEINCVFNLGTSETPYNAYCELFFVLVWEGETVMAFLIFGKSMNDNGKSRFWWCKCFYLTNKYFGIYTANVSLYTSYFCGYYSKNKRKCIWTYFRLYSNQCVL